MDEYEEETAFTSHVIETEIIFLSRSHWSLNFNCTLPGIPRF